MAIKDPHGKQLREHLLDLLNGGGAHARFDDAVKDMPEDLRGAKPNGFPHSAWMLLEHLRLVQLDILGVQPQLQAHLSRMAQGILAGDLQAAQALADWNQQHPAIPKKMRRPCRPWWRIPRLELYARIPWGDGQTVLREALLLADHNAYHVARS